METFVPKTKSDQKWLDSLICYMDYIHKFMVFPTMNTIYQNKKIGVWMNNQKRFKKVHKMPLERMELLSKVLPVWDKETDEKQQYLEMLLQQKWPEWLNANILCWMQKAFYKNIVFRLYMIKEFIPAKSSFTVQKL